MLKKTDEILKIVASKTDEVILFHSATGKDSIALLDISKPYFKKIVCCFMYGIKGFEHIDKYIEWAKRKYNVDFIQLPHFANASYIKNGYLGIEKSNVKNYTLNSIIEIAKKQVSIDWVILGMKQSDGLNRRLMLKTYELQSINEKTKKVYPLSHWANSDVMKYIELNNLIRPISYNKDRSSGFEPNNIDYLLFLKKKHPKDLDKLLSVFPMAAQKLFEYEYHKNNEENRNI